MILISLENTKPGARGNKGKPKMEDKKMFHQRTKMFNNKKEFLFL
jgi:hypothetical protein